MFTWSLSAEQQRQLAERLTAFLSPYDYLSDSYIIEFFSKDHWHSLPTSWQPVLQDLTYQQVADLLLDPKHEDRRYPSVWPLSLLAFRATAHALAFPRACRRERGGGGGGGGGGGSVKPEEFLDNQSQSSLLGHVFRKHVKPKKQHEIRKLGSLVKQLCEQTDCSHVVDVGSGQGHLTRFLSFGLGLSVTAMEADRSLVATATKYDGELLLALEKEQKQVAASSSSFSSCSSFTTSSSSFTTSSSSSSSSSINTSSHESSSLLLELLLSAPGVTVASSPRGRLGKPQSIMGVLHRAAERRRTTCQRKCPDSSSSLPRPAGGLRPHRPPRLRRPQRHAAPPFRQLPARARHHLRGVLLHEGHHQGEPLPSGSGAGRPGSGRRPLGVRLPDEPLGGGAAGPRALLQGQGGGVSRRGGIHPAPQGGRRGAWDALLPGDAGDAHRRREAGSEEGGNPDHKERSLTAFYRVRPAGSGPGWPDPRPALGAGAGGGHAAAARPGGGVLQPGAAAGARGGDAGAAGPHDLPAGERFAQPAASSLPPRLLPEEPRAGGHEALKLALPWRKSLFLERELNV